MPSARVLVRSEIKSSPRVQQIEGLFDISSAKTSELEWAVEIPIETRPWQIGAIVGNSGTGKTTIARHLFGPAMIGEQSWPERAALVDGFPAELSIKEITALLTNVGLGSVPTWLRPFAVLSNGEQFRAKMARALATAIVARRNLPTKHSPILLVCDEYTSVVDRTVAKVASVALAKTVRQNNLQFIAVTCHEDILDWLNPDWVYESGCQAFSWRRLRPRPEFKLVISRTTAAAWRIFQHHHYLDHKLHRMARCYLGTVEGRPAAFTAVLPFPHPKRPGFREHRTVCLPDFQGLGIGNRLSDFIASLYKSTGKPYRSVTGHPAMIRRRAQSKNWKMTRAPSLVSRQNISGLRQRSAANRLTASFEYVGPANRQEAIHFHVL